MSVKFIPEGPPPSRRGKVSGQHIAEQIAELKKRPGVWAIVRSDLKSNGAQGLTYKRHGCETTTRTQPDGTFTIYARWPA